MLAGERVADSKMGVREKRFAFLGMSVQVWHRIDKCDYRGDTGVYRGQNNDYHGDDHYSCGENQDTGV